MIIVSGALYVDVADRDQYLAECREVIVAARAAEGEQTSSIRDARVVQYEVSASATL